jgi:hypothetical protein
MNYAEFRASNAADASYGKVREMIKAAAYVDEGTGLTIEPRPVDKSTRIQQMLQRGHTDLSKWMHEAEMKKDAAFDWNAVGDWAKNNYGAIGGGALGLLLGAMLGRSLAGRRFGGLGMLAGGALGALGGYMAGGKLQANGTLANTYNEFRKKWNHLTSPSEKQLMDATPKPAGI